MRGLPAHTTLAATVVALGSFVLGSGMAPAGEIAVNAEHRTELGLTIYSGDMAMVRERRTVVLGRGINALALGDVSARLQPETVLLGGEGVGVLDRGFEFDLLSPQALLEASVGKTVGVARTNPATGEETVVEAQVLSAEHGVVLRIGDRIEAGVPGRLVFYEVPAGLRPRPTMVATVVAAEPGEKTLNLGYLTDGLGWRAEYVAGLSPKGDRLDITCFAALTNNTGIGFENARIQLAAGEVARPSSAPARAMLRAEAMHADQNEAGAPPQTMGDFYLYRLDDRVTLANRQTRQVALFSTKSVPVSREYVAAHAVPPFPAPRDIDEVVRPRVRLSFANSEATGPGLPLPAGAIRVYGQDQDGGLQFVGGGTIPHTPVGRPVVIEPGRSFDVSVVRRNTVFEVPRNGDEARSTGAFKTGWSYEVENARDEAVDIRLTATFPGPWKIVADSHHAEQIDAATAAWLVTVPAKGSVTVSYVAEVRR